MARVRRKSNAAAHHYAVHEGDVGFWEFLDAGVEDVFLAPQYLAEVAFDLRALPERTDIAAGAEPALARAFQQDDRDLRIGLEAIQRPVDVAEHLQRYRIDRLRAIEPDHAGRALAPRDQVRLGARNGSGLAHLAPSINLRDTISRMISLVPSSIWCTRKSRTIFSMPYSLRYQ